MDVDKLVWVSDSPKEGLGTTTQSARTLTLQNVAISSQSRRSANTAPGNTESTDVCDLVPPQVHRNHPFHFSGEFWQFSEPHFRTINQTK